MRIREILLIFASLVMAACAKPTSQHAASQLGAPEILALKTVAELQGISVDELRLIEVEARDFSDSSLGCPEPGMSYLQVITPGHRVLIEADGRRFDVRVSNGHARICRRHKSLPARESQTAEPDSADLAESARQDLSEQLQIPLSSVSILSIDSYSSATVLPGCQPACEDNRECGYVVGLLHDNRRYLYHVSPQAVSACPPLQSS